MKKANPTNHIDHPVLSGNCAERRHDDGTCERSADVVVGRHAILLVIVLAFLALIAWLSFLAARTVMTDPQPSPVRLSRTLAVQEGSSYPFGESAVGGGAGVVRPMITTPTLFILGAGASKPYGFPTGPELLHNLKTSTMLPNYANDPLLSELQNAKVPTFRKQLIASHPASIDDYLEDQQDIKWQVELGKRLIATELIPCENSSEVFSPLYKRRHWLEALWHKMKAKPDRIRENKVTFIVYNYDRVIEHFFTTSLAALAGCATNVAWGHVKEAIKIIHPHGILGKYIPSDEHDYPLMNDPEDRVFAPVWNREQVEIAARNISLYWEKADSIDDAQSMQEEISGAIRNAAKIVFLGFGFLGSNMHSLLPIMRQNNWAEIAASGFQMHTVLRNELTYDFSFSRNGQSIQIAPDDFDCLRVLHDYVNIRSQ